MSLTDLAIKNAKPRDKAYKLADKNGLCSYLARNCLGTGMKTYFFAKSLYTHKELETQNLKRLIFSILWP